MLEQIKTYYALKKGPNRSSFYSWNAPVFLFANENIAAYLKKMTDVSGKNMLTVAAGGDHAFLGLLAGAKNVDLFDLNYLQKHVVELKSKMIKHLSYSDFMHFFFDKNSFFSSDIIRPIWKTFSPGLKTFLLMYYRQNNNCMFRYSAAQHIDYDISQISYLSNETDFYDLSKVMPDKFRFEQIDISNVSNKFDEKYDIVLLSNIFEYLYPEVSDLMERTLYFYNNILCPIADKNLSPSGGQICLHYAWRTNPTQWAKFVSIFQRSFNCSVNDFSLYDHNFSVVDVPSMCQGTNATDVALIMTQHLKQR